MKKYMRISKFQNSNYEIAIHLKVLFMNVLKINIVGIFPKMRNFHFLGHHFCNGKVRNPYQIGRRSEFFLVALQGLVNVQI